MKGAATLAKAVAAAIVRRRAKRAELLAKLEALVAELKGPRAEEAWALVRDDTMTEAGHGYASTEEALQWFLSHSVAGWPIGLSASSWTLLQRAAATLTTRTGTPWTPSDVVHIVAAAACARLDDDVDGMLKRARRAKVDHPGQYEVCIDGALGGRLNRPLDRREVDHVLPDDVVNACLRDKAFMSSLVGGIAQAYGAKGAASRKGAA